MDMHVPFGLFIFMVIIILYGPTTGYVPAARAPLNVALFAQGYPYLADAFTLVFFGFGFLFSFLYRNGVTAIGHGLMAATFAVLWNILNRGLWTPLTGGLPIIDVELGFETISNAVLAAATILVTFGALVGRLSAAQLMLLVFCEVPIYAINAGLIETRYLASDFGGSLQVFIFGSVFGLACAFVMETRAARWRPNAVIQSTRASDVAALAGTVFMWCFWPGYNGMTAPQALRSFSATNTYLALAMGTTTTFTVQHILWEGKFNMNEIQYATLAGGVAMAAASGWTVQPFGALLIGSMSSLLSVLSFRFLAPLLARKLFLNDTCGTLSAFAIPGLAGGIATVIAAGAATTSSYADFPGAFELLVQDSRSSSRQAGFQLLLIATSVLFPLVGGVLVGLLLTLFGNLEAYYTDSEEYGELVCSAPPMKKEQTP